MRAGSQTPVRPDLPAQAGGRVHRRDHGQPHAGGTRRGAARGTRAATDASLTSTAAYASAAPSNPPANPAPRSLQVVPAALIAISPSRALDEPHASMAAPFRRARRLMVHAAGAPKPGNANGNASAGPRWPRTAKAPEPLLPEGAPRIVLSGAAAALRSRQDASFA